MHYGTQLISSPFYLSAIEIFIYLSLFKAILIKRSYDFIYKTAFLLLGLYLIVMVATSFALGTTMITLLKALKMMLPYTLLYSLPKLISEEGDWENFFRLLFPFAIIIVLTQIYQLITGAALSNSFGTDFIATNSQVSTFYNEVDPSTYADKAARPFISHFLGLIIMMGAVFYRVKKSSQFKEIYLDLIIATTVLIPILSATRSFVIAYFILFFAYLILTKGNKLKLLNIVIIGIGIGYILLSSNIIQGQLIGSVKRLSTIELLVAGDLSAGGTLSRFTEYSPVLLNYWKDSPVFGWGFSSFFASASNSHAGLANLLFNVGVAGFILFIIYWISLVWIPLNVSTKLSPKNPYKESLFVLIFVFFGYFVINNAGQQFTYLIGFIGTGFSQMIFLTFSDFTIRESLKINPLFLK